MTLRTVGLSCALLAAPAAASAQLAPPVSEYAVTSWSDLDGVPMGAVYAIAQDRAGYLWLGTAAGLVRFDGVRLRPAADVITGQLPRSGVGAVHASGDGSLLVGFATGEVRRIRNLDVQPLAEAEMGLGRIDALVEDRTESVWAVADGRARHLRDGRWHVVAVGDRTPRVINAYIGSDRMLYLGTNGGLFRQSSGDAFQQLSQQIVYAVSQGPDGGVWATHPIYGAVRTDEPVRNEMLIGNGYRAIHDRHGYLWVATLGKGLWRFHASGDNRQVHVAAVPAPSDDSAQALFEDREGNIWIGTPTGLHRLTRKPMTAVANAGPILAAEATTEDVGVWAGTLFDGLIRFVRQGNAWRRTVHSTRDVIVRSLHRNASGTLWIGTNWGLGRLQRDRFVLVAPIPAPGVRWITSDKRGTLWLGNGRSLFRYADGRLSEVRLTGSDSRVAFASGDRQGRLWAAFVDGSIGLVGVDNTVRVVAEPGRAATRDRIVYCIVEDSRGTVWFGATDGLHMYAAGGLATVTLPSEWPRNRVWAIVEDDERYLWLNTDLGVLRIHPEELARAAADATYRTRYRFFDGTDGLGGASVEYLRAARGRDGTLWFARGGVLTAIDPRVLRSNEPVTASPVRIETVTTEHGPFEIMPGAALEAGTRRLDVTFSVLHLTPGPRLRFRHRLEGFESDWRDAGARPIASYTNLSPGAYRLVVEAYSTEGRFGIPATWNFDVPPTIVQTRTFRATALLTVAALIGLAWWGRTRIVRRQFAAVLSERARLSREIHDTLLQGVVGIALHLDHLEQTQSADPKENAHRFERLRLQLEAYVRDARRSILDLRSPVLERRSFEEALNELGARLTADTNIHFSVTVKGKPRSCAPRMENELLRIAHEAIANAVRHSHANAIHVELRFDDNAVVLRVTDDGCGFNVERVTAAPHGRFGLVSMRERAKTLGGELRVDTAMHRGTDIEAMFPIQPAT